MIYHLNLFDGSIKLETIKVIETGFTTMSAQQWDLQRETVGSETSVADPDPVGSGLFGSPGSGSGKLPEPGPLSTKKTPCNSNFLVIKFSKIQFHPSNFFIFDFKCHRMFRFGKKIL